VRRVTVDGIYAELFPVLRPDGKKLAFDSNRLRTAAEPLNTSDQEKEMIEAALAKSRGKVAGPQGAAAKLGVPASTLESKIRQLGIEKRRFTTAS
jgi:transcriptional regulator with GAF, ATPase, and Fis domain